jgi:molecular chaperone DnaK (HSP70)
MKLYVLYIPLFLHLASTLSILQTSFAGVLVGHEAFAQQGDRTQVLSTCHHIKRLIGQQYDEVQTFATALPYRVVPGAAGEAALDIPAKGIVRPETVSAEVIKVRTMMR